MLTIILLVACLALSAVLGFRAFKAFGSREISRAFRLLGWALLPVGAYMAGLVTLASRIGTAFARWGTSLVFNPVTWLGVIVIAAGVVLLVGSGFRIRRNRSQSTADASQFVDV